MFTHITNIWQKELMDSIRDKRAMRQALLFPLVMGIFYAVLNPLLGSMITQRAQDPLTIPAIGLENAGTDFVDFLAQFEITLEEYEGDMEAEIEKGDLGAGLIIPAGFTTSLANQQPANLTLLTNQTSGGIFGSSFSSGRLDLAISLYNQQVAITRVQAQGVDPAILTPVQIEARDLATPEQLAGIFAGMMLPMLVGIVGAQGGMFIAIDVTAGEKERGTLESLLVTPAGDTPIFLGKLLAVFTMTLVPIILTFIGFWAASNLLPQSIAGDAILPLSVIIGAVLVAIPLAFFLNVVLMIISIRTKAFKDAQSALSPVLLITIFTAMAAAFVPPTAPALFLIPIYGPSALVGKLAIGGTLPAYSVLLSTLGSLLSAGIGILIALRLFNRERLLYSV